MTSYAKADVVHKLTSARQQLDDALEALHKLAPYDTEKAARAIHALNNYMMVVGITLRVIERAVAPHPELGVEKWLQALKHATELILQTTRELMATSGGAAEHAPALLLSDADFGVMVSSVVEQYAEIAERKHIAILPEIAGAHVNVHTDGVAVGAVLDNLISNAVKYSPPGSTVHVRVEAVGNEGICRVCDEGPGISEADQKKLFRPGTRLTARPTAGETSTGYGLSIAKELVERLGGRIWCESRLNHGACFSFSLPLPSQATH